MWIGTLPVGMLAKAFGRRFALQVGSAFGAASGVLSCIALLSGSFGLLLAGTLCGGLYAAAHQSYRFAAADTASVQFRAKAVAWVLAGGICAAVIGPAARDPDQRPVAAVFVCRDVFGAIGLRDYRGSSADAAQAAAAPPPLFAALPMAGR